MSDILLMSPPGLPRNGLVALYDPYRDAYGRNCLTVGAETFSLSKGWTEADVSQDTTITGWDDATYPAGLDSQGGHSAYRIRTNGGVYSTKFLHEITPVVGVAYSVVVNVKNIGSKAVAVSGGTGSADVVVAPNSQTFVRCATGKTHTTGNVRLSFVAFASGDALDFIAEFPQLNLGPQLFPYSPPAGAPGTLQTSLDYSGNGNHLTLGATTNASTDDPTNTGTAWRFDGGDFLTAGACASLRNAVGMTLIAVFKPNAGSSNYAGVIGNTKAGSYSGLVIRRGTAVTAYQVQGGGADNKHNVTTVADVANIVIGAIKPGSIYSCVNGLFPTPTSIATFDLMTTSNLTLGKLAYADIFSQDDIYFAAAYARPLMIPEMARIHRTLKSLITGRGVSCA